jgi:glycosyltransferase involved in cell wall biosynthesis
MKVLFFANRMPDLCGAFLHDIDLATELQKRGHQVVFLTIKVPPEGFNGGHYRGFRYMNYAAANSFLETSEIWICPHAPILPEVRKINSRGYNRPIIATCHYDGNYTMIVKNGGTGWREMLCFINSVMEKNYRKNIAPWPSQIIRTETIRPIMHRDKIVISEPFRGDCITLINANQNKGVAVFADIARKMPEKKFLAVIPYYGDMRLPPIPSNVEWVKFDDDIRNVLKRTRVLLVPSYYESFCRVAVEAMINGIPVIYSKPNKNSPYQGGSTEGMQSWIGDAALAADRDNANEWVDMIASLDDEDAYAQLSEKSKEHIESMNLFVEAPRIAGLVEQFARENPVVIRVSSAAPSEQKTQQRPQVGSLTGMLREPTRAGFGFSNGRLRIQR